MTPEFALSLHRVREWEGKLQNVLLHWDSSSHLLFYYNMIVIMKRKF